jgi:hypothetical protein
MWALAKAKPFLAGVAGAVVGGAVLLAGLHAWQLYWSLRGLIDFVNRYGPKIQQLP